MSIAINLGTRYAAAFGLIASRNQPSTVNLNKDYHLESFDPIREDFEDVHLRYDGNVVKFGSMLHGDSRFFAPPPLVTFSRAKKLVEIQEDGSDNVAVEKWGKQPWSIRMRGILIDMDNHHYPEQKVRELVQLFDYDGVVEVAGTQYYEKGIDAMYFLSTEINGVQGFADTVQYTITARSIAPVGFTLLNP